MSVGNEAPARRGASAEAIQHHYDVGTDFYRLWLDDSLTYSCALWSDGQTLEQAQQAKLALLGRWSEAKPGDRVLEIGCGWGSMMRHLVDQVGADSVVGLTLSLEQQAHIEALGDPRLSVSLESWEDHSVDTPYDAIVSIGALEHFVRLGLRRAERLAAYKSFFDRCLELLRPGGTLALQTIAKGNVPLDDESAADLLFLANKIFPASDVPYLAELCRAAERRFEVLEVVNHREHYARTCAEWLARLQANRTAAVELVGEETVAVYERYLRVCVRQFEKGQSTLLRFKLRKVDGADPLSTTVAGFGA